VGVRNRHVSGPCRVSSCSPLRRRPDAATWPTARDVSQRAEPDVRPLGRTVSTFIAEKTRRLSNSLTGDVPPQHLMCPVHSTDGQRPGHPASGVPVRSVGRQYAHAAACAALIMTRTSPGKLPQHANTTQAADIRAQGDCTRPSISGSGCSIRYVPGPTCRGSTSLYVPPLSYKRADTQRYTG
jgi:hypothetical protein